jgi:hypothetical protein
MGGPAVGRGEIEAPPQTLIDLENSAIPWRWIVSPVGVNEGGKWLRQLLFFVRKADAARLWPSLTLARSNRADRPPRRAARDAATSQ